MCLNNETPPIKAGQDSLIFALSDYLSPVIGANGRRLQMKDAVIPLGLEVSKLNSEAGNLIGRHPDTLTGDEWLQLGSEFPVGLKAVRAKCLDCAHTPAEVRRCVCYDCPLWPFRLGHVPKGYRQAGARARHERD